MPLNRSSRSLINESILLQVDLVVYVEGGSQSFKSDQEIDAEYSEQSEDITFWKALFSHYLPDKKLHFRAKGSRSALDDYVAKLDQHQNNKVIVAKDINYDEFLGLYVEHPNVLYTFGHSFENDVLSVETLLTALECCSGKDLTHTNDREKILRYLSSLDEKLKKTLLSDIVAHKVKTECLPKNNTGGNLIGPSEPLIDEEKANALADYFFAHYGSLIHQIPGKFYEVCLFLYGHMYAHYCWCIMNKLLKELNSKACHKLHFLRFNMLAFRISLNNQAIASRQYKYYLRQFDCLKRSLLNS